MKKYISTKGPFMKSQKLFFTFLILVFSLPGAFSQIYNHGDIYLEEGAELYIDGDYEHHEGAIITSMGNIYLKGNCTNLSERSLFFGQKGKLILTGNQQQINGNDPFFGELWLEADQQVVLNTVVSIEHLLDLQNGTLDLNGQTLILQNREPGSVQWDSGKLLSEQSVGRINWLNPVENTEYILPFGTKNDDFVPITFELLASSVTSVDINTYAVNDQNLPLPGGIENLELDGKDIATKTIDRFWYISPELTDINVRFTVSEEDLQGNEIEPGSDLYLLYYNENYWELSPFLEPLGNNAYSAILSHAGWYAIGALTTDTQDQLFKDFKIYPVPCQDVINIVLPDEMVDQCRIKLYDMASNIVYDQLLEGNEKTIQIITRDLFPGSYLLTVTEYQSNLVHLRKIIKQ